MTKSTFGVSGTEVDAGCWQRFARASFSPSLRNLYGSLRDLPLLGRMARGVTARLLPRGRRVWVRVRAGLARGLWLSVDPRYESVYVEEMYEPILQNVLGRYISQGGTFYDVGAHIGFFSLIAARLVGKSGAVFAFEADPLNARRIQEHVSKNALGQVQILSVAVWSRSGAVCFQRASEVSSHNTGSVVGTPTRDGILDQIKVEAVALDDFAKRNAVPTVVKIDVEGGEGEVLRGADRLLADVKPIIVCEVHNQEASSFIELYLPRKQYSYRWFVREREFPRHLLAVPAGADSIDALQFTPPAGCADIWRY